MWRLAEALQPVIKLGSCEHSSMSADNQLYHGVAGPAEVPVVYAPSRPPAVPQKHAAIAVGPTASPSPSPPRHPAGGAQRAPDLGRQLDKLRERRASFSQGDGVTDEQR